VSEFTLSPPAKDQSQGLWHGRFSAMASPCEVLIDGGRRKEKARITRLVCDEAKRIEKHWSRYRDDSVIHRINSAKGEPVKVDDETADMLDYAEKVFKLSDGRFDITSGVLRNVWRFDGSDNIPAAEEVKTLMPLIGWHRAQWQRPYLTLPNGMQLDFGGIGKEYAVDSALQKVRAYSELPVMINFGGDLVCDRPRSSGAPWQVGIDAVDGSNVGDYIAISKGGVATSGDANRFLVHDGKRYSHVLDATTGWPVENAARSVTVAAANSTLAGMLATLSILQGAGAEEFLNSQGVQFRLQR